MILQQRIDCLGKLGNYMLREEGAWADAKQKASYENGWFIPEFIDIATKNIAEQFLDGEKLWAWADHYNLVSNSPKDPAHPQHTVGIVMAGNIPLVGFHDFIAAFVAGHKTILKPSAKDDALVRHLIGILVDWYPQLNDAIRFAEILKNCTAYIATGSNNTSRYFEYYFGKYPHIIRRNKTSIAVLTGNETAEDLERLGDDVYLFFGLGCRNVTKLYVPAGYDFEPLLHALRKYNYVAEHHKYKNNYDYNMAIHILNNKFYMTNGSVIMTEDSSIFSPISQLNYEHYFDRHSLLSSLNDIEEIQCIVAPDHVPFGQAHRPTLFDYADKVDTMAFLNSL